jgi:predicted enzyme related to lactoylglutathione lyase
MGVNGIAFVMYPVTDMARAVAFYSDVLGLAKTGIETDFWVEFEVGDATFGIGNFEQVGKPGTAQSLSLEVSDMAQTRAELGKRGLDTMEPFATANCHISMVADPDGNTVWLHELKKQL